MKIIDASGEVIAQHRVEGWVRHIKACELDGDPRTKEMAVTCDDGAIYGLQVVPR